MVKCGEGFNERTPEEEQEMLEELARDFPGFTVDDCKVVCDDCHKKVMVRLN